jgi:hypothetical protein
MRRVMHSVMHRVMHRVMRRVMHCVMHSVMHRVMRCVMWRLSLSRCRAACALLDVQSTNPAVTKSSIDFLIDLNVQLDPTLTAQRKEIWGKFVVLCMGKVEDAQRSLAAARDDDDTDRKLQERTIGVRCRAVWRPCLPRLPRCLPAHLGDCRCLPRHALCCTTSLCDTCCPRLMTAVSPPCCRCRCEF